MPFCKDHVYPHLVSDLLNPKPINNIRRRIVPLTQGSVLEISVSPGVNFTHRSLKTAPPKNVHRIWCVTRLSKEGSADTAPQARTTQRTLLRGIHPAWLSP